MEKLINITGKALSGEWGIDDKEGIGIPVLRTTNFTNDGIVDYSNVITRTIAKKNIADKFLRKGDIIIEKSGGSDNQPVGRVVYFDNDENKYLFNNFTGLLRVKDTTKWLPKYIFYSLFANYQSGGTRRYENKTTGLHNLQTDFYVKDFEIKETSYSEQIEICELFDKITDLIDKRQQQLEKLDELVKSRFVEMFGDRYVNDKNWNTMKLGDSISFNNGKAHEQVVDKNGEYILVTSRAIASDFKDVRRTNELLFPLHKNDIVMVMSDVPNGKALAKCQLIDENNKYTLNQRICSFDNYNYNPVFLLFLLSRHPYFLSFNDGNGQTNLRKNDILDCELIYPPIELQNQFATFVKQVDKSKFEIKQSLEKLELLKKALMQKYFG